MGEISNRLRSYRNGVHGDFFVNSANVFDGMEKNSR